MDFKGFICAFDVSTSFILRLVKYLGRVFVGFCDSKCALRCSKARLQDRWLKYCRICCEECKCFPSGTYGNKDECPCYRDKKNSMEHNH
ncbi:putative gibberellin regulated protein [Helianthus anomalus]